MRVLLWYPEFVPQMTGGLLFPGDVTEKKSIKHWLTSDSWGLAEPERNKTIYLT